MIVIIETHSPDASRLRMTLIDQPWNPNGRPSLVNLSISASSRAS